MSPTCITTPIPEFKRVRIVLVGFHEQIPFRRTGTTVQTPPSATTLSVLTIGARRFLRLPSVTMCIFQAVFRTMVILLDRRRSRDGRIASAGFAPQTLCTQKRGNPPSTRVNAPLGIHGFRHPGNAKHRRNWRQGRGQDAVVIPPRSTMCLGGFVRTVNNGTPLRMGAQWTTARMNGTGIGTRRVLTQRVRDTVGNVHQGHTRMTPETATAMRVRRTRRMTCTEASQFLIANATAICITISIRSSMVVRRRPWRSSSVNRVVLAISLTRCRCSVFHVHLAQYRQQRASRRAHHAPMACTRSAEQPRVLI